MPWKTSDGTYLKEGRGWKDSNGIKHPSNWIIWSEDYKKNTMNLTWEKPLGGFDSFYYSGWNSDGDQLVPKPVAELKTILLSHLFLSLSSKQYTLYPASKRSRHKRYC